jgi:hypothetical protein
VFFLLVALIWLLLSRVVHACPICFAGDNGAVTEGVWWSVATLFGVTTVVMGAVIRFAARLHRAEKR